MTRNRALIGIVVGAVLTVLGPLLGLVVSALSLRGAFQSTSSARVAPEDKARHLSEGISWSMNVTAIGVGAGIVGIIVLIVSIVLFAKSPPPPAAKPTNAP